MDTVVLLELEEKQDSDMAEVLWDYYGHLDGYWRYLDCFYFE